MGKQDNKTFSYDLKRVDKVTLIIIWVIIAIIIEQAFLKGEGQGPTVMLEALPVAALATALYFINIKRFLKSLLFGLIPTIAVCVVMFIDEFSLDRHYILCIVIALTALYFNPKLLAVYAGIVDALIISLFIFAGENYLGDKNAFPYFLSVFLMLNGQLLVLFFLTKWGSAIIFNTEKNKADLQGLYDHLTVMISEINTVAEQVAAGTDQVAAGSQMISRGATDQAGAIEELSASLAQIAEQTSQNAQKTNQAREIAVEAQNKSAHGNDQMIALQGAMKDIDRSSEDISRIIKVIDDIAFQTNILSLNAAVEAARAGIHGKGFAVVAEEVRNLAQRSAGAAKETSVLIEDSLVKVRRGMEIANETAQALTGILDGAVESVKFMDQIAVASGEQAAGIAEISKGIEQLSQVVQTNSATARQTAAATEELSGQATMLRKLAAPVTTEN